MYCDTLAVCCVPAGNSNNSGARRTLSRPPSLTMQECCGRELLRKTGAKCCCSRSYCNGSKVVCRAWLMCTALLQLHRYHPCSCASFRLGPATDLAEHTLPKRISGSLPPQQMALLFTRD